MAFGPCPLVSCPSSLGPRCYGRTRNFTLLFRVPLGVCTVTKPVCASGGTVVVISDCETTVNAASLPLNRTLVAPVRSVPRIVTGAAT